MAEGIQLFLCGDVMLGRGIDQILPDPCDPSLRESYLGDDRTDPILRASIRRIRGATSYPWGDALATVAAGPGATDLFIYPGYGDATLLHRA